MSYRDWGDYGNYLNEAIQAALDPNRIEVGDKACPLCGNPLDIRDDGEANCDFGHFRTQLDP